MQKTYAISWFSHATHQSGEGKAAFTKEKAELMAAQLNKEHPLFIHTPRDTAAKVVPPTPAP